MKGLREEIGTEEWVQNMFRMKVERLLKRAETMKRGSCRKQG